MVYTGTDFMASNSGESFLQLECPGDDLCDFGTGDAIVRPEQAVTVDDLSGNDIQVFCCFDVFGKVRFAVYIAKTQGIRGRDGHSEGDGKNLRGFCPRDRGIWMEVTMLSVDHALGYGQGSVRRIPIGKGYVFERQGNVRGR